MSDLTDAAAELLAEFQAVSDSSPTIEHDGETVDIMPNPIGNDPMFVGGGTADSARFDVCTLADAWDTAPEDQDVVELSGHATAPDGSYQVLNRTSYEAWIVFTLGNADGR